MILRSRLVHVALAALLLLTGATRATAQDAPDQPVDMKEIMKAGKPPRPIRQVAPVYPRALAASGVSATVTVSFIIDPKGGVQNPVVVKSSSPGFDQAAIDAILGWKFSPAEMNGRPVSTRVAQKIEFRTPGGAPVGMNERHALGQPDPATSAPDAPDGTFEMIEIKRAGKMPKPIKQAPPVYPPEMARAGLIGTVKVVFIIDVEGRVQNPYVIESNNPWFERPAINAILGWKFQPAEMNSRPVNTRATQAIEFHIDQGGSPVELWRVTKDKDHGKLPPEFQWDTPPTPVSTMFPVYPFEQLKANQAGKVKVTYVVGPDGRVAGSLVRESTAPEFSQAVLAMIDAWRFAPAKKKDGTPAYANLSIEYDFRTNGRGDVPVNTEARGILRDLAIRPKTIAGPRELDKPIKPRSCRPPVYPSALQKAGQPGSALIEFFVDENGDAQLPRIVSCSASEFGYAAVQAVATWRFEPPTRNKRATVVRVQAPIEFSLPGPRQAGQN